MGWNPEPPTIGALKAQGVRGVLVQCDNEKCRHIVEVPFERIHHDDKAPFVSLRKRNFICSKCGAVSHNVTPDWTGFEAPGLVKHYRRE